jgi:hypothetical protein
VQAQCDDNRAALLTYFNTAVPVMTLLRDCSQLLLRLS